MKLSVVVPILNEVESLSALRSCLFDLEAELTRTGHELEVVLNDNASDDGSSLELEEWDKSSGTVTHVRFTKRLTFQQSIINGFRTATGDCVAVFQGDLQDPWELLLEFFENWLDGCKVVVGVPNNRHSSGMQTLARRVFYKSLRAGTSGGIPVGFQDFYLLDKSVYKELANRPNHFQFIRGTIARDYPIDAQITYSRNYRKSGKSKFRISDKYELALDALLIHSSSFVRLLSGFGLTIALVSLVVLLGIPILYLLGVDFGVPGWLSTASLLTLMIGIASFAAAIQFEYLRRILVLIIDESKEQ